MEYLSVLKRNMLLSHGKAWKTLKCVLLKKWSHSERLNTVWLQPHDSWEKAQLWRRPKVSGCHKLVWGQGMKRQHRGYLGPWKYAVWYYKDGSMSKPTDCTIPRVQPKVNYGLWVILICQWKVALSKQCWQWGMLTMGEVVPVWAGVYGKSLCLPLSFAENLKLL